MNIEEIISNALEEDSLAGALSYAAVIETSRAVKEAIRNKESGEMTSQGGLYDTCFLFLFKMILDKWGSKYVKNN